MKILKYIIKNKIDQLRKKRTQIQIVKRNNGSYFSLKDDFGKNTKLKQEYNNCIYRSGKGN